MNVNNATATPRPFRILALDGGGILGTFTAGYLAFVEEELANAGLTGPAARVANYFDLITGTSTGGIIAAGLAAGLSAATIENLYRVEGTRVFAPRRLCFPTRFAAYVTNPLLGHAGVDLRGLLGPAYDIGPLTDLLRSLLKRPADGQDVQIGDLRRRLLLPTVQLSTGQTVVIKTGHLPGMFVHPRWTVYESILATAAAPTFFPLAMVDGRGPFADGGLWANNPAMVGVAEAVRIARECRREIDPHFGLDDVHCLSIGAGEYHYGYDATQPAGIAWWLRGKKIITAMMASQSQGVSHQVKFLLGDRQRRINFHPTADWTIDNVEAIPMLADMGRQTAQETLQTPSPGGGPSVLAQFFGVVTPDFVPF